MNDVLEPNDDDILAALDFEPEEDPTVVDVTQLSNLELSNLFNDVRDRLLELSENGEPGMMSDLENTFGTEAGTPEARALHSTRLACLAEMSKRGMR
jgi:hypothetical protein